MTHFVTCIGCRLRGECAHADTLRAKIKGLNIRSMKFGCKLREEGPMRPLRGAAYNQDSVSIFIDPETRCEYLAYWSKHSLARGSITPRLDRDGKPMCEASKIGGAK